MARHPQLPASPAPAPAARRRLRAAVLCAAVLLAGCSGSSPSPQSESDPLSRTLGEPRRTPGTAPALPGDLEDTYQEVVQDVLPSVVQINAESGLGSGVVYDEDGHVVTNAHVVGDAERFEVLLATGQQPVPARLVASYPEQDLALIRLSRVPDQLRPATFADSSEVAVGQLVLAMGNPLGLSSSVTQGIVSAVGRSVSEGEGGATLGHLLQTSAAINPGNSGGALVDLAGEVVGIPTLAARDPQLGGGQAPGIGFALPSNTVTSLADQLIEHGRVVSSGRAELGVQVRTVLGDGFDPAGVAIVDLADDGPAGEAGLRPGDVLVELGGEPVKDVVSLSELLASHEPEEEVEVGYQRNGERHTATVTLGEA